MGHPELHKSLARARTAKTHFSFLSPLCAQPGCAFESCTQAASPKGDWKPLLLLEMLLLGVAEGAVQDTRCSCGCQRADPNFCKHKIKCNVHNKGCSWCCTSFDSHALGQAALVCKDVSAEVMERTSRSGHFSAAQCSPHLTPLHKIKPGCTNLCLAQWRGRIWQDMTPLQQRCSAGCPLPTWKVNSLLAQITKHQAGTSPCRLVPCQNQWQRRAGIQQWWPQPKGDNCSQPLQGIGVHESGSCATCQDSHKR